MRACSVLLLLFFGFSTPPLQAQEPEPHPLVFPAPASSDLALWGSGILAGTLGATSGMMLGLFGAVDACSGEQRCSQLGHSLAALEAASVAGMVPFAVHRANANRGSYGRTLLATAGVGLAGFVAYTFSHSERAFDALALTIPLAQVVAAVLTERATTNA